MKTKTVSASRLDHKNPPAGRTWIPTVHRTSSGFLTKLRWLGLGLLAVAWAAAPCQAVLQTYDGFDYTGTGPNTLDGKSGGYGWDNVSWGEFLGGATNCIVTNGSLSDPTGTLFVFSNRVVTAGGFSGRYFAQPPGSYGQPGSTTYFSLLIRPESEPETNYFFGLQLFSNGNDTGTNTSDVLVGKHGGSLFYGLEYSSNDVIGATNVMVQADSGTLAASNQTVFLVVRVDFADPSGPDTFSLYVNPVPGSVEPVTPDATLSVDIGTHNGFALHAGNGAKVSFDEIRMGTTFMSVSSPLASPLNLLTYEPFAYVQTNITGTLNNQSGGTGWDGVNWGQFLGGADSYTNVAESLSDPSGLLVTTGNKVTTGGGEAGRYPNLGADYGAPGTTNYYSFLVRPEFTPGPTNSFFGMRLFSDADDGPNSHDLFFGKTGSGLFYGLQYITNDVVGGTNVSVHMLSTTPATSNETALLVTRVVFGPPNSVEDFSLYVNPTPGAPEPLVADATLSVQLGRQNGFVFMADGGPVSFDEVRIGTTYADVTPSVPPELRIVSLQKSGEDVVITWMTAGGNVDVVQATGDANGSYTTNGFTNISPPILNPGSGGMTTNYVEVLGATNQPARYYRILRP